MNETGENLHPSLRRLYAAAKKLRGVTGESAVADLLGFSPQRVHNWGSNKRGVSDEAAILAQKIIGCDAVWIQYGPGDDVVPVHGGLSVAESLPSPYIHPNETTRRIIALLDATDEAGRGAAHYAVIQALKECRLSKESA